ncbi:MAG: hypothetical protein AAGK37_05100 [Pseudomonadota bacterium]
MRFTAAFAICLASAVPSFANDYEPKMQEYLDTQIKTWAQNEVLVAAIRAQNETTTGYSQDQIDALDQSWRDEVGLTERPTIEPVLQNAASEFLRSIVAETGGTVTEVFVMDARGLNVAASAVTSDFWQGDEAKFSETYPNGDGAVHFGDVEFDESSQTYQGQISLTIADPSNGEAVGAMTVGVNAEALF